MRYDDESVLLGQFHQGSIGEVRMHLDLYGNRSNLADCQQFHQQLPINIRHSQMPSIALSHTKFQLSPKLLQRLVVVVPIIVDIHQGPVHVHHVEVLQLHQLKGFLDLALHTLPLQVEQLSGDEEVLPAAAALCDHHLYSCTQGNFVVVHAGSIDVSAGTELQSFPEQFGEQLRVLQFVGAQTLQLQDLLVGKGFHGGTALLLLLLSHAVILLQRTPLIPPG